MILTIHYHLWIISHAMIQVFLTLVSYKYAHIIHAIYASKETMGRAVLCSTSKHICGY